MDLYSLHTSIESVLDYLERVDPAGARRARHRYACFEHFSHEPQAYGAATTYHGKEPCEGEVVAQLLELQSKQREFRPRNGQHCCGGIFLCRAKCTPGHERRALLPLNVPWTR
jgi:erythromycin esterase-like protein